MSKRLQVVLEDGEWEALRETARRRGLSLSAWVRRTLDEARSREPGGDPAAKVSAVRAAARYGFPTSDIDDMLDEIEQGYGVSPSD
ncbi:MAG: antitoxin [Acidimicrobiales bacterium]